MKKKSSVPVSSSKNLLKFLSVLPAFSRWWTERYGAAVPFGSLWEVYVPLARWILANKRQRKPQSLYIFGVSGNQGAGKSVLCEAVAFLLNRWGQRKDGGVLVRSIDEYYLTHAERERPDFRSRGYNPEGISNRGPAGTHDLALLRRDLAALESLRGDATIFLSLFDKSKDERSPGTLAVKGPVGILLLEGWFLGASAPAHPEHVPAGLKRSTAEALADWQDLFARLDALLFFERPSLETIVAQREKQEQTLERRLGRRGMTPEQLRRFVQYLNVDCWEPGVSSPEPPAERITFRVPPIH